MKSALFLLIVFFSCSIPDYAQKKDMSPLSLMARDQIKPAIYNYISNFRMPDSGWIGRYLVQIDQEHMSENVLKRYLEWIEEPDVKEKWNGEHIGKWFETGVLTWQRTHDESVKALMQVGLDQLLNLQDSNGYIGSYLPGRRFFEMNWNYKPGSVARFDLWNNLLTMMGLLKYYEVFQDNKSFEAARAIGDLVVSTFGKGKQDIMQVMHNRGQGPLVAILPISQLYGITGDKKYLDFCKYITEQFGKPHTLPIRIVDDAEAPDTLVLVYEPNRISDDGLKHCEFEITMRGMIEYYRLSGIEAAWVTTDAVFNRMYLPVLQSLPYAGFISPDKPVPVIHHRGLVETCDIPPALRWWGEAFRQTGDTKYLEAIERMVYNQMLAHNRADKGHLAFGDFEPLEIVPGQLMNKKISVDAFNKGTDCCLSQGAIGLAWIPSVWYFSGNNEIVCNLYHSGKTNVQLGEEEIQISQNTDYPVSGQVHIQVNPKKPLNFTLSFRIPSWAEGTKITVGKDQPQTCKPGTLHKINRKWQVGDEVLLSIPMVPRMLPYSSSEPEYTRIEYGPLILAATQRHNPAIKLDEIQLIDSPQIMKQISPQPEDQSLVLFVYPAIVDKNRTNIRFCALSDAGLMTSDDFRIHFMINK